MKKESLDNLLEMENAPVARAMVVEQCYFEMHEQETSSEVTKVIQEVTRVFNAYGEDNNVPTYQMIIALDNLATIVCRAVLKQQQAVNESKGKVAN